jgi:pimeloyl-ACP methyl ester carboxylesterase
MPIALMSRAGLSYSTIETLDGKERPWAVFHHGVGLSGDAWAAWYPQLLPHFRLLTFDVRGYGRSPLDPARLATRTLDDWVSDVITLLDEREIDRAVVIGESLGGTATLHAAAMHPDRIQACIVCSTGFRGGLISELPKWHGIIEHGGVGAWSDYMNERRFAPAIPSSIRDPIDAMQRACTPEVVLHDADMLRGLDLSDELTRLQPPVLILAPGQSPFPGARSPSSPRRTGNVRREPARHRIRLRR